jgi:hypothetical protein
MLLNVHPNVQRVLGGWSSSSFMTVCDETPVELLLFTNIANFLFISPNIADHFHSQPVKYSTWVV